MKHPVFYTIFSFSISVCKIIIQKINFTLLLYIFILKKHY
ncbi:hypothetical protein ROSINTL182_09292 [Roseburia intestinalis L1-82]|uniref:Uncharacterized protein n=1 Tax=Roseburia intestinalis L1-82 TaxID=536231 RepID=C7GH71_9FIRM|nr:hypothetical protein ROSINTL182_09292 [Roseburia intestinalis L1-82]